jgi:hypothetical protein
VAAQQGRERQDVAGAERNAEPPLRGQPPWRIREQQAYQR